MAVALMVAAKYGCTHEARERPPGGLLSTAGDPAAVAGCLHQSTWLTPRHAREPPTSEGTRRTGAFTRKGMSVCVIAVLKQTNRHFRTEKRSRDERGFPSKD